MEKMYAQVTNTAELTDALVRCRAAQQKFAEYTQEQVDRIFLAAASAPVCGSFFHSIPSAAARIYFALHVIFLHFYYIVVSCYKKMFTKMAS